MIATENTARENEGPECSSYKRTSYGQILRSSSIVGGASVLNILVGLVRTKAAAVLLGPVGIGLIGLFQSLMTTASTVSALGFATAGTRQIAEASGRDDVEEVAVARRALFWGTMGLAALGASVVWVLREGLARTVLGDAGLAGEVGWLALGVALTVAAGSQGALLTGLRRIGDIARVSVLSSLLATVLGVGALWVWGQEALLLFVLAMPVASFVFGHVFVARLPKIQQPSTPLRQLTGQWRLLASLGAAFMVAGLAVTVGQLAVRTLVQHELGAEALGYFQAAWSISMIYIGFVLSAMGQDYYPRLTVAISDSTTANRLVNEQTEVALLLAAPVLLAMVGLTPWVIDLLYSAEFSEAADVLRWQILGDVLKVACWPLGFILLASGDGRTYMLTQSLAMAVFVGITWLGLPTWDIEATGLAFLAMYLVLLPVNYGIVRFKAGFRWEVKVFRFLIVLMLVASLVSLAGAWADWFGGGCGVVAALSFGLYSLSRLRQMVSGQSPLGRLSNAMRRGRR